MLDNIKIGNQITLLRKEKHLTGEKLAELLDVSPQAVSKWENGKNLPETALLPSLSEILGTTIDSLLTPKELLILNAVYSDGIKGINITQSVSGYVNGNKLNIIVNPLSLGLSLDSDRIGVLTVKYQTPDGIFFGFAVQDENLYIDLSAKNFATQTSINIIGAYYGNKNFFKSALQKMEHYEYFKWNAIGVNHETFPSNTASDDMEYLTLIYLNTEGIHVISCQENDTLYYNDDRTGLYLKDNTSCILPGIIRLNWEEGMECPWAGSLYASLKYMGERYTYEEIMGLSGACYRICFTDCWDWSCTDALVAFDYSSIFFKAVGYNQVWASRLEKGDRKAEREYIMRDIKNGKPVIAINLRVAPEWGVITGYINNGGEFLCRTYFDKEIFEEHKNDSDFCKETGGYLVNDFWPFLITHFGDKKAKPSQLCSLTASLNTLVDSFDAQQTRGYHQGKDAYESWMKALSNESDFNESGDKESLCRKLSVNECMLFNLIDARRSAEIYLRESAVLLPSSSRELLLKIADNYAEMVHILSVFRNKVKFCYETAMIPNTKIQSGVCTPDLRREQIELLAHILNFEQENVDLIKIIIKAFEDN